MENENKKPFHLVITDNATGETLQELDFDALIGAAHLDEETAAGLLVSRCSTRTLAATTSACEDTLVKLYVDNPALLIAKRCFGTELVEDEPENEEPENNQ